MPNSQSSSPLDDIIVGFASGYDWRQLRNYAISLSRCGFVGRRVLFLHDVSEEARINLTNLRFDLFDFDPGDEHVTVYRWKILSEWLEYEVENGSARNVVTCDVSDVIFQLDPGAWLQMFQKKPLVAADEFVPFVGEQCNNRWITGLYGEDAVKMLAPEHIVCSGTIAGSPVELAAIAADIYGDVHRAGFGKEYGYDQGALNYLLRTKYKDKFQLPNLGEGFIITPGFYLAGVEALDNEGKQIVLREDMICEMRDGVVCVKNEKWAYCIVHQFNRSKFWYDIMEWRYTPFPSELL